MSGERFDHGLPHVLVDHNQLDHDDTAALLHDRGILFAPDAVVGAGGIIHATGIELRGRTPAEAAADVETIGATLGRLLRAAAAEGLPPTAVARRMAESRTRSMAA
jgi:leucine dehydrogenase